MRNRPESRDYDEHRWRGRDRSDEAFPEYDEYGLHGDERREYRGRESHEQQSRGGQGGRSGVWDHRFLPREYGAGYRQDERDERPGYRDTGSRGELEGSYRGRSAFGRESSSYRGADDYARYGGGSPDFGTERAQFERDDDYSRSDYGNRNYGRPYASRPFSHYDEYEYGGRDVRPSLSGNPYARPPSSSYDRAYGGEYPRYSGGGYENASRGRSPVRFDQGRFDQGRFDQGRYMSGEYGREFQRRSTQGPKGYKRSDERIREDVCDRLGQSWDLDSSEIEVSVSSGEVTLTGTVQDRAQKHRAENVADGVSGVGEVHNQLRVKREWQAQGERDQSAQTATTSATGARSGSQNQNRSS